MKRIFSILFALVLVLSFSLVTAVPATAAVHQVNPGESIQAAIDAAGPGDTISVAAGTYVEDLVIPGAKTNLELVGATGATIKGVLEQDWPTHTPAISIWASGVKIHGFTIESPSYSRTTGNPHSSGITVGATNVEIYENTFVSIDDGTGNSKGWCTSIETYGQWTPDVSGLNIHDNIFTSATGTDKGSEGIFINYNLNNPTPAGTVTIENNTFGGQIFRAIATERSRTTIRGNTIRSSFAAGAAWNAAFLGIYVARPALNLNTVVVTHNTVEGFFFGLFIATSGSTPSNTSIHHNTVDGNNTGIWVRSAANDIAIHHNTVTNSGADGMSVDGDSNSIHHNTANNNGGDGIKVAGDNNSIHHNTATGNGNLNYEDVGTGNTWFKNK